MTVALLQNNDPVPHFVIRAHDGGLVDYSTIWQRRNLLLVAIDSATASERYVSELAHRIPEFEEQETTVVITHDGIAGLPTPGLIVADRWGEIIHLVTPKTASDFPTADQLLPWVEAIEYGCPECEGEAK